MKRPPQFWAHHDQVIRGARGRRYDLKIWGWSDVSAEDAAAKAVERSRELDERGASAEWYYPAVPLREQVLTAIGAEEEPVAIVTRNRYGVEVLNTDAIVIADVDLPEPRGTGLFAKLFSRRPVEDPADAARDRIGAFAAAHPDLGVHSYRTRAGFRVFITGSALAPGAERATVLLEELGSDPLYVTLCGTQKSFRARLTPKPWRVGHPALGVRWPGEDAGWIREYEARCAGHAVCAHEMSFGPQPSAQEKAILDFHARATGADSGDPLA